MLIFKEKVVHSYTNLVFVDQVLKNYTILPETVQSQIRTHGVTLEFTTGVSSYTAVHWNTS